MDTQVTKTQKANDDKALEQTVQTAFEQRSAEWDRKTNKPARNLTKDDQGKQIPTNLGRLYQTIRRMFLTLSKDARSVFRGFFPAFGNEGFMKRHVNSLFLPEIKNELEEALRKRLTNAADEMKYLGTRRALDLFMRNQFQKQWTRVIEMPHDAFVVGKSGARIDYQAPFNALESHGVVSFQNQLWLIGGKNDKGLSNEVYSSFDGTAWTAYPGTANFSARSGHAMTVLTSKNAQGVETQTLWLTGGKDANDQALNDTWSFDGTAWTEHKKSTTSFSARSGHAMAVLTNKNAQGVETQTLWLTGGKDAKNKALNDTWSFDGTTWTEHKKSTTSFSARSGHAMAVLTTKKAQKDKKTPSAETQTLWLSGGQDANDKALNDTWSFDGTTWKQHSSSTSFSARKNHRLAVYENKLMLIGGEGDTKRDKDTKYKDVWSFDGTKWRDYHIVQNSFGTRLGSKTARISAGPGLYIYVENFNKESISKIQSYLDFNTPPFVGYRLFNVKAHTKPLSIVFSYNKDEIDKQSVKKRIEGYFQRIEIGYGYKHEELKRLFATKENVQLWLLKQNGTGTTPLNADDTTLNKTKDPKDTDAKGVYFPLNVLSKAEIKNKT